MVLVSPALMQLTENMAAISFNTSLQKYGGDMTVASMSILTSVMQFVMLLLPGLVQGAQPKNIDRVKKTFCFKCGNGCLSGRTDCRYNGCLYDRAYVLYILSEIKIIYFFI